MSVFQPWKIVHIQINEEIPSFPFDHGIGGLFVVFWWNSIPLGHQLIPASQLPVPASHLINIITQTITPAVGDHLLEYGFKEPLPTASKLTSSDRPVDFGSLMALDRPLARLQEIPSLLREEVSHPSSTSVVICTRERPEPLQRCLRSLQKLSRSPLEILVVDNAPNTDATRQVVSRMPGIRYVVEPQPGLSAARNAGIRQTTGCIIAFTDDDVTVHPDWIACVERGFENQEVLAVTGLILPAELETEAQFLFQGNYSHAGWGYRVLTFDAEFFRQMKHLGVPVWRIGAGANMAFRRQAFELVGEFDKRLGAGAAGCSEDSELWYRVLAAGGRCRYEPTAVVYHHHRRDLESLKYQMYQYMRGHITALLIQFEKYRHWGNVYRAFGFLPAYYLKRFAGHVLRGAKPTLGAEIRGCISGVKFYLQHRHHESFNAKSASQYRST